MLKILLFLDKSVFENDKVWNFLYVRYVLINNFVLILLPKNLEKLGERI